MSFQGVQGSYCMGVSMVENNRWIQGVAVCVETVISFFCLSLNQSVICKVIQPFTQ